MMQGGKRKLGDGESDGFGNRGFNKAMRGGGRGGNWFQGRPGGPPAGPPPDMAMSGGMGPPPFGMPPPMGGPMPPAPRGMMGMPGGGMGGGMMNSGGPGFMGGPTPAPPVPVMGMQGPGIHPGELTKQINDAKNPLVILELWSNFGMVFDEAHLGNAMHKIAKVQRYWQNEQLPLVETPALQEMVGAANRHVDTIPPTELSKIVWALARLDFPADVQLLNRFAVAMLDKLKQYKPQALTTTMWGFATLGYVPGTPLLQAVHNAALEEIQGFVPQDVAYLLWAFAKMEFTGVSDALMRAALVHIIDLQKDIKVLDLVKMLWACTRLRFNPGARFLTLSCEAIHAKMSVVDGGSLGELLWAFKQFSFQPTREFLESIASAMPEKLEAQAVSMMSVVKLLQAYSGMTFHPGPKLLSDLVLYFISNAAKVPADKIPNILMALAVFAYNPGGKMLHEFSALIEAKLEVFKAADLCTILWCYALFNMCTPAVWNTLTTRLATFTLEDISDEDLLRLYQVYLLLDKKAGKAVSSYKAPSSLMMHAWQHWQGTQEAELRTPMSDLHNEVSQVLFNMNIPHEDKALVEGGVFMVDILLPSSQGTSKTCVIPCSKEHFASNTNQPLGSMLMRILLLEAYGWSVLTIPYFEWQNLRTPMQRMASLQTMLARHIPQVA